MTVLEDYEKTISEDGLTITNQYKDEERPPIEVPEDPSEGGPGSPPFDGTEIPPSSDNGESPSSGSTDIPKTGESPISFFIGIGLLVLAVIILIIRRRKGDWNRE